MTCCLRPEIENLPLSQGVAHVLFFQPAFAGEARSQTQMPGVLDPIRVAIDRALHALVLYPKDSLKM